MNSFDLLFRLLFSPASTFYPAPGFCFEVHHGVRKQVTSEVLGSETVFAAEALRESFEVQMSLHPFVWIGVV